MTFTQITTLPQLLAVAGGGALGCMARFLVSKAAQFWFPAPVLPWGTLTVNLLGCLGIGLAFGWLQRHQDVASAMPPLLISGFLGGFTTFSAFALELTQLPPLNAIIYAIISVSVGVLGVCFGRLAM